MDGIEKITGRIAADASQEIASIQAEARRQADEITARYEAQAKREAEEIAARGRRSAEERQARLASVAQLDARKLELAAKQEVPFSTIFEVITMLLAFEVIRFNFNGFFSKLGSRFGGAVEKLMGLAETSPNTGSST